MLVGPTINDVPVETVRTANDIQPEIVCLSICFSLNTAISQSNNPNLSRNFEVKAETI